MRTPPLRDLMAAAYIAGLEDRPLITSQTLTPVTADSAARLWAAGAAARPVPLDDTGRAPIVRLDPAQLDDAWVAEQW